MGGGFLVGLRFRPPLLLALCFSRCRPFLFELRHTRSRDRTLLFVLRPANVESRNLPELLPIRHSSSDFFISYFWLSAIVMPRSCSAAPVAKLRQNGFPSAAMNAFESRPVLEVLVVDDSPVSRKIFEQILPADLYSVSYASDGSQALQLFKEKS